MCPGFVKRMHEKSQHENQAFENVEKFRLNLHSRILIFGWPCISV